MCFLTVGFLALYFLPITDLPLLFYIISDYLHPLLAVSDRKCKKIYYTAHWINNNSLDAIPAVMAW